MGDHKVAIVTGGASGIGKAVARRFASDGVHVVITDLQRVAGQAVASELGGDFLTHDVTDEEQWAQIVQTVQQRHGRLDVLVNNAGILGPRDAVNPENTRLADWQRVFAVNVDGVFLGCRAAIPAMRATGGGSIVNISSVAGLRATPYATAYGASKAAVAQLTRSVAQHCAEQGLDVRCNSVHPGDVRTPLWEKHLAESSLVGGVSADEVVTDAKAAIPLRDFTPVEHIAAAVAYLASDEARFITGTTLVVDGGILGCDTFQKSGE